MMNDYHLIGIFKSIYYRPNVLKKKKIYTSETYQLAAILFTSSDMKNVSLRRLKHKTRRVHNNNEHVYYFNYIMNTYMI